MGGYLGRKRTEFTKEDDDNLCWWISRKIPDAEDGGRLSFGIWRELLSAAAVDKDLAWAHRHTLESWRERYRKRRGRFDPQIERFAKDYPPEPTARYGLSRRYNKNPAKAIKFVEHDVEVIELTEGSASEPESDLDAGARTKRRKYSSGKATKAPKRRRVEDSDESSPALVIAHKKTAQVLPVKTERSSSQISPKGNGKGKAVDEGSPEPNEDRDPYEFSLASETFEPDLTRAQQLNGSHRPMRQTELHLTPAPSPTLVQRASSAIRSPRQPLPISPPTRRVNLVEPPSSHPSTSFRNVRHSSPAFAGPGSPSRSAIQSHNTSATEPSSRSMVVPELTGSASNVGNAPAESSITRESTHKPSSPISQPMRMARKRPSRQQRIPTPSDEGERKSSQESQWAPYRNTRSRSRSVELASLPQKSRKGKGREILRKEQPLEPVHESQVEQEHDAETGDGQVVSGGAETMEDERNVANILIPNPDEPVSQTLSGVSTGQVDGSRNETSESEDETEEEGEGVQRSVRRGKEEEEEETQDVEAHGEVASVDNEDEETAKFETAPTAVAETLDLELEDDVDDDIHDISSLSESEDVPSPKDEDGTLDISSDDEATEQQFVSQIQAKRPEPQRQRRSPLSSDDEEVDQSIQSPQKTPLKSAREVLDLFGSSPEIIKSREKQKQQPTRKPFNDVQTGSPGLLQPQNQKRPRQSLPASRPTRNTHTRPRASLPPSGRTFVTPVNQTLQRLTGPLRTTLTGGESDHPSSPSSVGSLPQVSFGVTPRHSAQAGSTSRGPSSLRRSIPLSQPRQAQLQSQAPSHRRASADSTSSEMQATFPISGTRADAVRQQIEQELKESPYAPPSGTKAAWVVASSQRVLRPRKRA
ncbi:hypothetical protein NP233_g2432 [Leucocoprinus birnbaumii]|uniref:Rap1 Myb domain-containing protein n=1 Tax=Leucocoprinus birnbaumii TaxID=56174 RepID=A0AAD5VYA5_9AGAR|nr:hypothetical protein NP233_g2432 [Leucocoprinus birnbaumii]